MIDEKEMVQEFDEAAVAFTERGDEIPIINFCKKYGIKYTLTTKTVIEEVEEVDD